MKQLRFVREEGKEVEHFPVKGRHLQMVLDRDFSNISLEVNKLKNEGAEKQVSDLQGAKLILFSTPQTDPNITDTGSFY